MKTARALQTRRTRTAGKVEIPSVDDHVSKLEHMGRETVKKLADVREAAVQAGIDDLQLPPALAAAPRVETVGAFQQLALAADLVCHPCCGLHNVLLVAPLHARWGAHLDAVLETCHVLQMLCACD